MRLTEAQKRVVKAVVKDVFGSDAEVFVFGSRIDDSRRGGDYDFLVTTSMADPDLLIDRKLHCLARLHGTVEFDEEKIDLVVLSAIPGAKLPIHEVALREGIQL